MSLTSYGCHYSHRNYSHGSDVYRSKTGLKRSSACAKVNPWRVISVAYQRVGQQTGKSQAYLFVPWTAMPVLSLLLILSHFPKECCGCCTDQGLLVASSLVPLGSGEGCCGQNHAVAEPDPLFHLCWYAAWSRVSSLDEMPFLWLEIASEVHRRGQLSHQAAASSAW